MKTRKNIPFSILSLGVLCLATTTALAETSGQVTVRYTMISPLIALIAGLLILIIPRLLNYVVAIYLILIGLIGIFGR